MTPYQLAKIVDWAGDLKTRKRLQKVVFLLSAKGCKAIDAHFILHHYGPYSYEVASLADQMLAQGLLDESAQQNQAGVSYSYKLTDKAARLVHHFERAPQGKAIAGELAKFEATAKELLKSSVADLEYGSTIVYFYRYEKNWKAAIQKACKFKRLKEDSPTAKRAIRLAQAIMN